MESVIDLDRNTHPSINDSPSRQRAPLHPPPSRHDSTTARGRQNRTAWRSGSSGDPSRVDTSSDAAQCSAHLPPASASATMRRTPTGSSNASTGRSSTGTSASARSWAPPSSPRRSSRTCRCSTRCGRPKAWASGGRTGCPADPHLLQAKVSRTLDPAHIALAAGMGPVWVGPSHTSGSSPGSRQRSGHASDDPFRPRQSPREREELLYPVLSVADSAGGRSDRVRGPCVQVTGCRWAAPRSTPVR